MFDASALGALLIQRCPQRQKKTILCLNFPWSADVRLQKEQTQRGQSSPRTLQKKKFDFCLFHFIATKTKELQMTPGISAVIIQLKLVILLSSLLPGLCGALGDLGSFLLQQGRDFSFFPFPHQCLNPPWGMFSPVKQRRFLRSSCVNKQDKTQEERAGEREMVFGFRNGARGALDWGIWSGGCTS